MAKCQSSWTKMEPHRSKAWPQVTSSSILIPAFTTAPPKKITLFTPNCLDSHILVLQIPLVESGFLNGEDCTVKHPSQNWSEQRANYAPNLAQLEKGASRRAETANAVISRRLGCPLPLP